jgi:CMP-N-acetylneuraminic acid synthetase
MSVIAFIFARGGSKGIPRKNLRPLGGRPLLAWSIAAAQACPEVGRIIVSTDDAEIAETARRHGAEVPFLRPPELATDDSPEWLSWQHAVRFVESESGPFDVFLSVPTTSPLRLPGDLAAAVALLRHEPCDAVISITPAARNPYFNMVRQSDGGFVEIASRGDAIANRQAAPPLFDITTVVYAVRPAHILSAAGLMQGRVKGLVVPKERAIDIDDDLDFRFAEFMVGERPDAELAGIRNDF